MPIDTHIEGDAGECRATARWLGQVADAAHQTSTTVNNARTRSEGAWTGVAGQNFRSQASRLVSDADDASEKARSGGRDIETFAGAVDTAKGAMARAREIAVGGGLTVDGETIQDPVAAPTALTGPVPPAQQTAHDQAVTAAGNQQRAYDQARTVADDARTKYEEAERTLTSALSPLATAMQAIVTGLAWAGRAYGGPAGLYGGATKWSEKAGQLAQRAQAWRRLANNPTISPAGRATAYAKFMENQRNAARAGGVALRDGMMLRGALFNKAATGFFKTINANPGQLIKGTSTLAKGSKAVLGKVPYVGAAVTAFGIGSDIKSGRSVGDAVTRNVVPFAAGSAATAGLMAVGVAGGPLTLAAVGAGMVVSWGVGKIIDNYGDDIANAAGDAVDAVGDAAGDAVDSVGDAIGSIF